MPTKNVIAIVTEAADDLRCDVMSWDFQHDMTNKERTGMIAAAMFHTLALVAPIDPEEDDEDGEELSAREAVSLARDREEAARIAAASGDESPIRESRSEPMTLPDSRSLGEVIAEIERDLEAGFESVGVANARRLIAEIAALTTERDDLSTEVREWLCESCATTYPGPPQKGIRCVMCPKCGGVTAPRTLVMRWNALVERDGTREQTASLRKALERYGRHDGECGTNQCATCGDPLPWFPTLEHLGPNDDSAAISHVPVPDKCTCGLSSILNPEGA